MGTSDLPEIYTRVGMSTRAQHEYEGTAQVSVYISGKSQVPMLQLIYSTWVTHLQEWGTAGMLRERIYMDHVKLFKGVSRRLTL